MSKQIITQETIDVIEHVSRLLYKYDSRNDWKEFKFYRLTTTSELSFIRNRLLYLDDFIQRRCSDNTQKLFQEEVRSTNWLFYEEEEEIIPIYDEAIEVSVKNLILEPKKIAYLLKFMGVSGGKSGIDVENHDNKGYHFHYGKVKRDVLVRYDVLMTFDKKNVAKDKKPLLNIPLYIEPHATGKCTHIDPSIIGHNRRLPIYLVCEKAMSSRGLKNFLSPSNDSSIFYPMA